MVPKLQWRKIGGVNIFELYGIFAEPWVSHKREELRGVLEESPYRGVLLNLREVEKVDRPGAEAILETVRQAPKGGILGHNLTAYFVAEHMSSGEPIPIFEKDQEAIGYFEKELAETEGGEGAFFERRRFPRIKTALPVEFELNEMGSPFFFEAAVLNLSEGGFYGRFLDSKMEELALRMLNPFDLKMLQIRLQMGQREVLKMEGKLLRTEEGSGKSGGIGVEFYNLGAREGERIRGFLLQEGESSIERGKE